MNPAKKRGLGKGLEALFGSMEITIEGDEKEELIVNEGISFIDINEIRPNKNQPRQDFSGDKIDELAMSIKVHGVIQPIVLRKIEKGYEIVAGERRWRAARQAGLKEIPSIIKELTDEQNVLIALIENMQREDLNAIEEASGLERLASQFSLNQEEIAKGIGKSRPYVANALRLLKLPEPVQEMISKNHLTGGHGKAIAGLKNASDQYAVAKKCAELNWSVRELEAYVKSIRDREPIEKKTRKPRVKNREVLALEEDLKVILGTKVNIILGAKKGKIEIEYYSRSELERLLEMLQNLK
jgi:ParB family chromosome partitioning protein